MDAYKSESTQIQSNGTNDTHIEFGLDVLIGLSKSKKQLPSKYLYDKKGCMLYNKITKLDEYYLTDCEIEILNNYCNTLFNLSNSKLYNVIELGPGEGIKTEIILEQLLNDQISFQYIPIDISPEYTKNILSVLKKKFPELKAFGMVADYIKGLNQIRNQSNKSNIVLFFGSSIGNFTPADTRVFLYNLWSTLKHDDRVLIGFDLCKDYNILKKAYDDDQGTTCEFNLNLLQRINRELDANFQINKFRHYASYNVFSSAMESYLVSQEKQSVQIGKLNHIFHFSPWEAIHLEYSHKYLMRDISALAVNSGFEIIDNFIDSRNYFVDSVWRVIKK